LGRTCRETGWRCCCCYGGTGMELQLGRECKKQFCWAHARRQASKQASGCSDYSRWNHQNGATRGVWAETTQGRLTTSPPLTKVRVSSNYWLSDGNTHSSPAACTGICPSSMDCLDTSHVSAASRHACATRSIQGNLLFRHSALIMDSLFYAFALSLHC
jgi:hypothetical protein